LDKTHLNMCLQEMVCHEKIYHMCKLTKSIKSNSIIAL